MPPRLNRRQQRELEELESLGVGTQQVASSEDEAVAQKATRFSNFLAADELESESEDAGSVKLAKSRKKKKKKKSQASEDVGPPPASTPQRSAAQCLGTSTAIAPPKNEKKALKKARAKEKKAGVNELEKALAELSITHSEVSSSAASSSVSRSLATLLSVSLAHLDSEAEMRKFFGKRVIQANRTSSSNPPNASSRRQRATQRSNLTRPRPTWWSATQREGLSIRLLTPEELQFKRTQHAWSELGNGGEKWWTVEYSQRYKSVTKSFIQAVMSGHPEALWEALKRLPWHADNLLQLGEIYRHREEYSQAVDFVDRAIFTYERAFIGAFNFTSGINRLDFDRVENRPFFLAVHRQTADFQRRGCIRTAFEFARLLYSLDPWVDPHGALFHLDSLALKSGMAQWLLDVYEYFSKRRENAVEKQDVYMDPSVLPGFVFARVLALKIKEDEDGDRKHERSTDALMEAITSFPYVVPILADKLDVTLAGTIRAHRDLRIETDASGLTEPYAALHLLSHMYVQRSFNLWKESNHASWFASTVNLIYARLSSTLPITTHRAACVSLLKCDIIRSSIYRHVVVLESTHRRLFSFIPSRVLEEAKGLACDPLPPPNTAVNRYNEEFFRGVTDAFSTQTRTRSVREADARRLAQIVPDVQMRRQLEAVMAIPEVAARFPGGLMDMLAVLGQEGMEEFLIEMVIGGGADAAGGGGGQMPGQMPGFEMLEGNAPVDHAPGDHVGNVEEAGEGPALDEDDDEDEGEQQSVLPRAFRNMISRIWGRPADDSSSDSDFESATTSDPDID